MNSRDAFLNAVNEGKLIIDYFNIDSHFETWQAACQYKDEQYAPMIETASLQAVKLGRSQARIAELEAGKPTDYAVQHVTEIGPSRRSYVSSDGWAMIHAERLADLEVKEEELEAQRVPEGLLGLLYAVGHHGVQLDEGEFQIGPDEVAKAQELYALLYAPPAPTGDSDEK